MIAKLQKHLAVIPPGPIPDTSGLAWLLANAWTEFTGDNDGIEGKNFFRQMEGAIWNPPLLTFTIEHHGSRHFGSTLATLQDVAVDLAKRTVSCTEPRSTQRHFIPPRLNPGPIADEIAFLIVTGKEDNRLKWYTDGRVALLLDGILPDASAVKETLDTRRQRLKAVLRALKNRLVEHGWRECGGNVYETIKE
jgi:hypothetical protein